MLHTTGLSVGYEQKTLIKDIGFSFNKGEVLCLLGSNGCGKSTLLRTLLGLLRPQAGNITLQGAPLAHYSAQELAQHIAYVPQAQRSVFAWAVLDAVLFGALARLDGMQNPSKKEHDEAHAALAQLGIGHLEKRTFNTLSGGEQQLVLLARSLMQKAPLLILDEPTASLDFANQIQVLEQITTLRNAGFGILMCTHQSEHVRQCADKVLLIKNQQLYAVPPQELSQPERLAWLYDVSEEKVRNYYCKNHGVGYEFG